MGGRVKSRKIFKKFYVTNDAVVPLVILPAGTDRQRTAVIVGIQPVGEIVFDIIGVIAIDAAGAGGNLIAGDPGIGIAEIGAVGTVADC